MSNHTDAVAMELPIVSVDPGCCCDKELDTARSGLVKRARFLASLGLAWHGVEAAIAIGAGVIAGSVALVGFGADSLVELVAAIVILWRFHQSRAQDERAEQRAQKLIGLSFFLIATYVAVEATISLVNADRPDISWVGIALSVVTLATMPPLAIAKARVGAKLNSAATTSEGRQNMLCAYLAFALLVGLVGNTAFGWWWLDPIVAFLIAGVAVKEGRDSWQGQDGCCSPVTDCV